MSRGVLWVLKHLARTDSGKKRGEKKKKKKEKEKAREGKKESQ